MKLFVLIKHFLEKITWEIKMMFFQDIMMHAVVLGILINIEKIILLIQIFTNMQMEILGLLTVSLCGKRMVQRVFIVALIVLIYFHHHRKIATLFLNIIKVKQLKVMWTTWYLMKIMILKKVIIWNLHFISLFKTLFLILRVHKKTT